MTRCRLFQCAAVRRSSDLVPEAGVAIATGRLPGCMASMVLWKEVK